MGTINGLPAHILFVHAVVVLLPLAALLLVLTAVRPSVRRRLAGPNAVLSVLVLVIVPFTTSAGEWLEERLPETALIEKHAELGDTAILVAAPVAVLAMLIWWRQREAAGRARTFLAPSSAAVTRTIAALAVVVAGLAVYDVYRIGDSGAKSAWSDTVSSTPARGDAEGEGSD
ncbi:DUF2231 domain-containing protein [Pseudosporangium ferrugineum]|uniref:DUF2231 domain-containing protein n=1 Tax=Pseudosporangium ferrugineum TaxID=439699 RepID=A0A2T0RK72_9ACTN|nr:DUF2231 domain-containing protein [Pseudosporangium ferrugineum]PRY21596.1 hypothetical protein CLV70_11917 [Pseudosporangium ferrugineum]